MDFTGSNNNWELTDPADLFDAKIARKLESTNVKHTLEREARGIDALILWLDCDLEGENICFEVMSIVCPYMNHQTPDLTNLKNRGIPKNVFRVRFSSLVPSDIRKAFKNSLRLPNLCESEAVDARQEMDLKIGVAFTRFLTLYCRNMYGFAPNQLISYGPCQMPTLWFCVNQLVAHENAQPEKYHLIDIVVEEGLTSVKATWNGGRIFDEVCSRNMKTLLSEKLSEVVVIRSNETEKQVSPPSGLNTVELLKKASSVYGIGPHRALQAAEHLYLRGLITYPRTESTKIPKATDIRELLGCLAKGSYNRSVASDLLIQGRLNVPDRGKDVGDHPPILPCPTSSPPNDLSGETEKVYMLVVNSFLAAVSPNAVFVSRVLILESRIPGLEGHTFTAAATRLLKPGFMAVTGSHTNSMAASALPTQWAVGKIVKLTSVVTKAEMTSKPPLLTESALLSLMESNGVGTDASMATHIKNIIDRQYVNSPSGNRQMVPTRLGKAICKGIEKVDCELARPIVRSIIEKQCGLIAQGKAVKDSVVTHVLNEFKIKFQILLRNVNHLDTFLNVSYGKERNSKMNMLSRCGQCRRYLFIATNSLICKTCEQQFALPLHRAIKVKFHAVPIASFRSLLKTIFVLMTISR